MTPTYQLIRNALLNAQQVVFTYQGLPREVCPHVLGYKDGREKVLVFQFGGQSSRGPIGAGQWRCLFLDEVSNVTVRDGDWHSMDTTGRPQTCVDEVDVEMRRDGFGGYTPYAKRA